MSRRMKVYKGTAPDGATVYGYSWSVDEQEAVMVLRAGVAQWLVQEIVPIGMPTPGEGDVTIHCRRD